MEGEYHEVSDQDKSIDESDGESSEGTTEAEEEKHVEERETLPKQLDNQTTAETAVDTNFPSESDEKSSISLPKTNEGTIICDKQPENPAETHVGKTVSEAPKISSPVIIDNKINGKFEVSIISEDEVEKTLRSPISRSPSKSVSFEEETSKKTDKSPSSKSIVEKTKSSSRRVSFAEPHYTEWQPPDEHLEKSDQASNSSSVDKNQEGEEEEEEEEDLLRIEFKHSNRLPSADKGEAGEILSPDDVYHMFSKPKSILKKNFEPYQHVRRVPLLDETSDEEYHIDVDDAVKSTYNLVRKSFSQKKTH